MPKKNPNDRLVDEETKYDSDGAHRYRTYEDEDGNRYTRYEGVERGHEILGFENREQFEDNML